MDKEDTVNLLRSLLISKKGTYELGELLKDFKEEAGYSLPSFGYKTPLDFLKSVPDSLQLIGSYQQILVKPVASAKTKHISALVRRQNSSTKRWRQKPCFKSNVSLDQNVSNKSRGPSHIRLNSRIGNGKCNEVYKNNCTGEITVDLLIDNSKSSKCDYESNHIESKIHNLKERYFDSDEVINEKQGTIFEDNTVNNNIIKDLNDITKLNLQNFADVGEYVEVCVSVIWNPHNFTLQLRRFKLKLQNLMAEMQLFYNENGDKHKVPDLGLISNQLCAAQCKTNSDCSKWYRAIILDFRGKCSVIVGLIDYGAIMEIDINDIRFLHRRFGNLPPQALSGHLANIRPCSSSVWPEESIERFSNLVFERELIAGIVDLSHEEMWLSVALSFTEGEDVHVSDTLVEENLAVFHACVSDSRICLPWFANKRVSSSCHPVPEFWFHPKEFGQSRNLGSDKREHSKPNTNVILFDYSESNARLHEMFLN